MAESEKELKSLLMKVKVESEKIGLKLNIFSCSTQNGTALGGEGSGVGDQDRVGSPCVNQEILGPTCHIQLHPWLQPRDGYL